MAEMTSDEALRLSKILQRIVRQIDSGTYQINYALDIEEEEYLTDALDLMEQARELIWQRFSHLRKHAPATLKSSNRWERQEDSDAC